MSEKKERMSVEGPCLIHRLEGEVVVEKLQGHMGYAIEHNIDSIRVWDQGRTWMITRGDFIFLRLNNKKPRRRE
jgi:DNA topoisomerase VI subunit A